MEARWRRAGGEGAGVRSCVAGIKFPRLGRQSGGRPRADASLAWHGKDDGPTARRNRRSGPTGYPSTNMEYGQRYLERLRAMSATGGLLPKVMAAYNAGQIGSAHV